MPNKKLLKQAIQIALLPLQVQLATSNICLVMIALCKRADHHIFALWFLSIFFFPRLISAAA